MQLIHYRCGFCAKDFKPKLIYRKGHPRTELIGITSSPASFHSELEGFMCDPCWEQMQRDWEEQERPAREEKEFHEEMQRRIDLLHYNKDE